MTSSVVTGDLFCRGFAAHAGTVLDAKLTLPLPPPLAPLLAPLLAGRSATPLSPPLSAGLSNMDTVVLRTLVVLSPARRTVAETLALEGRWRLVGMLRGSEPQPMPQPPPSESPPRLLEFRRE